MWLEALDSSFIKIIKTYNKNTKNKILTLVESLMRLRFISNSSSMSLKTVFEEVAVKAEWSLAELLEGQGGVICRILLAADDYARLAAMGLCVGRRVEVVRSGSRMVVRSGDTVLGLHGSMAAAVRVSG